MIRVRVENPGSPRKRNPKFVNGQRLSAGSTTKLGAHHVTRNRAGRVSPQSQLHDYAGRGYYSKGRATPRKVQANRSNPGGGPVLLKHGSKVVGRYPSKSAAIADMSSFPATWKLSLVDLRAGRQSNPGHRANGGSHKKGSKTMARKRSKSGSPTKRKKGKKGGSKKRRSPAQIAQTKALVARNKAKSGGTTKRRKKKGGGKRKGGSKRRKARCAPGPRRPVAKKYLTKAKSRRHHKWHKVRVHMRRTNPSMPLWAKVMLGAAAGLVATAGTKALARRFFPAQAPLVADIAALAAIGVGVHMAHKRPFIGAGIAAGAAAGAVGPMLGAKVEALLAPSGSTAEALANERLSGLKYLEAVTADTMGAVAADTMGAAHRPAAAFSHADSHASFMNGMEAIGFDF